jgi:hypothetical protein
VKACAHCSADLATTRANALFCSGKCRARASRRYRVKLPADAYPEGALRGCIPLGKKTKRERVAELATAREI